MGELPGLVLASPTLEAKMFADQPTPPLAEVKLLVADVESKLHRIRVLLDGFSKPQTAPQVEPLLPHQITECSQLVRGQFFANCNYEVEALT